MTNLPEFRTHGYDQKFDTLADEDIPLPPHTSHYVNLIVEMVGELEGIRILDLGCGRGELVHKLRKCGARAFGVEIDSRFIESGKLLNERYQDEYPVLSVMRADGISLFPAGYFDLVISNTVLEHVAALDSFAEETARLLRPGGTTLHQFPARRMVVEPHYGIPFAHWLPKNGLRWQWIRLMLIAGCSKKFFPDLGLDDRTSVIYKYSVEETFYRSPSEIRAAFDRKGIVSDGLKASMIYLRRRFGLSNAAMAWLMCTFRNSLYSGTKSAGD